MAETTVHCEALNRQSKYNPHGILTMNFSDKGGSMLTIHHLYERREDKVIFGEVVLILPRTDQGEKRTFSMLPGQRLTPCADINLIIGPQLEKMGQFSQASVAFNHLRG